MQVTHLETLIVQVKWLSIIPQVNLDVPRDKSFKKYSPEFGYRGVQLLVTEFPHQERKLVQFECSSSGSFGEKELKNENEEEFTQFEFMRLIGTNQCLLVVKKLKII